MSHQFKLGNSWILVLLALSIWLTDCSRSKQSVIPSTTPIQLPGLPSLAVNKLFAEVDGFIQVEAESFHSSNSDGTLRQWIMVQGDSIAALASGKSYMAIQPPTETTVAEALSKRTTLLADSGSVAMLSYKVYFNTSGLYYVWVSSYSPGNTNNTLRVGVDGYWPESSAWLQWCNGKDEWTWSSAQGREDKPCGTPSTIKLTILESGYHTISFAGAKAGFKFDQFILTLDKNLNL